MIKLNIKVRCIYMYTVRHAYDCHTYMYMYICVLFVSLQADFAEVTPIPVNLAVSESDSVPPLPEDLAIPPLGGPLTPVLRRYTQGDQPAITDITHEVGGAANTHTLVHGTVWGT